MNFLDQFQVAELKLIFRFKATAFERVGANEEMYSMTFAFVYWFSHPSPPSPTLKLSRLVTTDGLLRHNSHKPHRQIPTLSHDMPLMLTCHTISDTGCHCKDRFPLQVRLSIQSGLGLSLQAGPSVTRSLGSDVARIGDIQDEIQTKGSKFL